MARRLIPTVERFFGGREDVRARLRELESIKDAVARNSVIYQR